MAGVPPAGHVVVQEEPLCRELSISIRPSLLCSPRTGRLTATSTKAAGGCDLKKTIEKNMLQTTAQSCLYKGAQIHKMLQRIPCSHAQTCDSEEEKQEAALTKNWNHHWKYSHCCLTVVCYFKPVANALVVSKPWVQYLWITLLYLPREHDKNKGKILGIYSGFQSGRTGGSPAVWAELQKWDWRAFLQVELCPKGLKNTQ